MLVFVHGLYDHVSFKAPYEKKAEAAKKKYAEEMAAYEAKWCLWPWVRHVLYSP